MLPRRAAAGVALSMQGLWHNVAETGVITKPVRDVDDGPTHAWVVLRFLWPRLCIPNMGLTITLIGGLATPRWSHMYHRLDAQASFRSCCVSLEGWCIYVSSCPQGAQ